MGNNTIRHVYAENDGVLDWQLTWADVIISCQLIAVTTRTVVGIIRVNAHLRTFSVVELAFVHRAAS